MPKTLVVDDDPATRVLIEGAAARMDKRSRAFVFAETEAEALRVMTGADDLDIALVTVDSDAISGMDLFRQLGGVKLRVPRIALTDGHDLSRIRKAMNDGAVDFLTKPLDVDDLAVTIDKAWADCERRREAWKTEAQLAAIRREIDIAGEIQKRILPREFPGGRDFSMSAEIRPAKEMGGDFYDFFEIGDQKLGLVVADVSGKGVPAAFFMAVARTLIQATANTVNAPNACLEQVNTLLCRHNIPGMFVSVFYGVLDTKTWVLEYANGGHLPPYLVPAAGGDIVPLEGGDGVVLGITEDVPYEVAAVALNKGDALFFYTDGLTEAFDVDRNQFSDERLIQYLLENRDETATALAENVFAFVNTFTGEAPQSDDITSLVIKRF